MWGMAVSLGEAEQGKERPARRRASRLVGGSVSTRRTLLACVLHILLVWTMVFLIIEDNYESAVKSWKTSAENIALAVAAHAAQTQGAADLVVKSMVDWIAEERIETEQQFRQVMGEKRFFEAMRNRILGQPQIVRPFLDRQLQRFHVMSDALVALEYVVEHPVEGVAENAGLVLLR